MNDWFFRQGGRHRVSDWFGAASVVDDVLLACVNAVRDRFNAVSSWFARRRLRGLTRLANEFACEGLTLAAGGFVVLYALALPAFQEADEAKWMSTGQYSVTFLDRYGNEIGRRGINIDDAVPLEEIPDVMIKATMATEDRRFFQHFGVDLIGTARALVENLRANSVVQGGSTLTQQLAKNLFLSSERSITRKVKEVFLAIWLEAHLSKRDILKLYLDRAYMGGGAFGVEAAAQFYFGKSIRDITMAEAAMLAGLFKAPTKFAPHRNLAEARARANDVLTNMVEAGYYDAGEVYAARLNPAKPIERVQTRTPDWFLDWAFEEVQRIMQGRGEFVLTVRTTVDLDTQFAAEQVLETTVQSHGRANNFSTGALVAMEPGGAVRALVGGVDYGESQFNRATRARRQPGSSFKTYVYAAALENGYDERTMLRDRSPACGRWSPRNYNGSFGSGARVTMQDAFKRSLNTTAVALSLDVGRSNVVAYTDRLGVSGVRPSCSMALGDTGITPLEHTAGYAVFANGGKAAKPYAILEVFNSTGDRVYAHNADNAPSEQIVPLAVAEQLNRLMAAVVESGTGRAAELPFTHAVGKTGTSSSYRDAWFMGFTGQYVTGVWLGNDNYRPMTRNRGGVTGGSYPAQIWQQFMSLAHRSMDIPTIPGLRPHPVQIAEAQRIAALPQSTPSDQLDAAARTQTGLVPDRTRALLSRIEQSIEKAISGVELATPPVTAPPGGNERRAEGLPSLQAASADGRAR